MPHIRFIKDATLELANEDGTVRRETIKAGTIHWNVKEGTAARWERRRFAERYTGPMPVAPGAVGARDGEVFTHAGPIGGAPSMPPVPPPPPPSPEDAQKVAAFTPPPPPPPPSPEDAQTQPARRGRPNAAPGEGEQGNGDGQS